MSAIESTQSGPTLAVMVPAFNEAATIGRVLRRVP